jgi:hypothetical protein
MKGVWKRENLKERNGQIREEKVTRKNYVAL